MLDVSVEPDGYLSRRRIIFVHVATEMIYGGTGMGRRQKRPINLRVVLIWASEAGSVHRVGVRRGCSGKLLSRCIRVVLYMELLRSRGVAVRIWLEHEDLARWFRAVGN
jgi:hypothetical protein